MIGFYILACTFCSVAWGLLVSFLIPSLWLGLLFAGLGAYHIGVIFGHLIIKHDSGSPKPPAQGGSA